MHGPCGDLNPQCPCMEQGRCRYGYPKPLREETFLRENVFPYYRRRDSAIRTPRRCDKSVGGTVQSGAAPAVQVHINIEICTTIHCIKCIYKYVHKGANRALIEARQRQQQTRTATPLEPVDEVQQCLDTRYIAPHEAAYRIFKYRIYGQSSHVEVLPVHLPGEQVVYFPPGSLEKALAEI